MKWMISCEALFWLAVIWYVVSFSGLSVRWLPRFLTGVFVLVAIIHVVSPGGILFLDISTINEATTPWGETIVVPATAPNPWRAVSDVGMLGFFVLVGLGCVRLYGEGRRRRAWFLAGGFGLVALSAAQGTLVDLGVVDLPYLFSYGFAGVVLVMSSYLTSEVVRSASLSRELVSKEDRWRRMLESVELAVVGLDFEGNVNFANPYLLGLTGYELEEIIGLNWFETLVEEKNGVELRALFQSRKIPSNHQNSVQTKGGAKRVISWSNVPLYDPEREFVGSLSIGADITDKLETEDELRNACEELESYKNRLLEENIHLQAEIVSTGKFSEIVGESPALNYVLRRVDEVAPTDTTVLLQGETGVGKELVARAIHRRSERRGRSMLKVDCAGLPASLIETELFGHVRGAYTGAEKDRKGRFELADGGTLFLDEIGELPLDLQSKLLRVVQDGEFERIGGEETTKVDVRFIAASNRDLKKEVEEGRFRGDLYYRLSVFPISVPPLRVRRGDTRLLAKHFVAVFSKKHRKEITKIPRSVLGRFETYGWPGNVRELQNVVERAVITTSGEALQVMEKLERDDTAQEDGSQETMTLEQMERKHILSALETASWKISGDHGAAIILGLHPNTLRSRMSKLGIMRQ
jgi:PAS domain S-box-containing protein